MSETLVESMQLLQDRDNGLAPNTVLSSVAVADGKLTDVIFHPDKATECLTGPLAVDPENDWAALQQRAQAEGDEHVQGIAVRKLLEIRLVRMCCQQVVGTGPDQEPVDYGPAIAKVQAELYGHYDPELFRRALHAKIISVSAMQVTPELEIAKANLLDELEGYLGAEPVQPLEVPTPETLAAVQLWLNDQFGDLFEQIDAEGIAEYDVHGICRHLQLAMDTVPAMRKLGWHADPIEKVKNVITTQAGQHRVVVPLQRKVKPATLKKLEVHEVLGHGLRSAVAEVNGDRIGSHGTATYSRFEESFEIAMEQCVDGKVDPNRGIDGYFAIGLAETLRLPPDRVAYILRSIRMLSNAEQGITPAIVTDANQSAALRLQRTYEGMTDVDAGVASRRDINYLHGLDGAWRILNYLTAHDCLDRGLRWLLSAKFNPFEAADRQLVANMQATATLPCPMPPELEDFFTDEAA